MAAETHITFDGWSVNRVSGEMTRHGRASRLPQQPLRILIELYDHAGEIVSREQLVKALWPQGIVDFDNGLNVAVRKLRVALDDVADAPKYIETLPKVGYRFVVKPGAIASVPANEPITGISRRARLTLGWGLLAAFVLVSVAWWGSRPDEDGVTPASISGGTATLASAKHVPSVRAQELFLQGIHERSRRDVNATTTALAKFEAALREDPEYAEAWAAYGFTLTGSVMRQMTPPGEDVPKARAAAERAIALDPDLVEGYVLMSHVHMDHDKDFAAAGADLERARATRNLTGRFWHYSAMWNAQQGHVDAGLADMRRAREMEPMTLLFTSNHAFILLNARRNEETIELLRPIIEANPGFDQARGILARALMATGDLDGALAQLTARKEIGLLQADLALVYLKLGRRADALRELERVEANGRAGFGVAYDLATIYTGLGDLDRACEILPMALSDGSILVNWMRLDPRMDALRGRKCFADVEKRLYREG
ncbi:MAG: winged helix-turn-helix domain-containing protein [Steroidobacteraceae bacterium]|nr:winged helix-turn-helix domain-containing protein [Steroidobacteraceae bacterium]